MISFDNDKDLRKSCRNAREFGSLDPRLYPIVGAIADEYALRNVPFVVTSVWRHNSSDHRTFRAVDIRVWALRIEHREQIAEKISAKFPVPEGEKPTLVYYDRSDGYVPHYHCRVPAVPGEYPGVAYTGTSGCYAEED